MVSHHSRTCVVGLSSSLLIRHVGLASLPGPKDLSNKPAEATRPAYKNFYIQPYKVTHLGYPLARLQFHNSAFPGIIEAVGRHWVTSL
jgi:hypothetical protein